MSWKVNQQYNPPTFSYVNTVWIPHCSQRVISNNGLTEMHSPGLSADSSLYPYIIWRINSDSQTQEHPEHRLKETIPNFYWNNSWVLFVPGRGFALNAPQQGVSASIMAFNNICRRLSGPTFLPYYLGSQATSQHYIKHGSFSCRSKHILNRCYWGCWS